MSTGEKNSYGQKPAFLSLEDGRVYINEALMFAAAISKVKITDLPRAAS